MLRTIVAFVRANLLVTLLVLVIIVLVIWKFTEPASENFQVAPAPIASEMITPGAGRAAAVPAGTITFCFRLDGREDGHLPALMGSAAQNTYANGLSGSNWSLPATSTGTEPYGILSDGTIFAKKSFLQQYGMVSYCELKADRTGWQASQMVEEKVNGEDAFVSHP